jgi:hypothetical protein
MQGGRNHDNDCGKTVACCGFPTEYLKQNGATINTKAHQVLFAYLPNLLLVPGDFVDSILISTLDPVQVFVNRSLAVLHCYVRPPQSHKNFHLREA